MEKDCRFRASSDRSRKRSNRKVNRMVFCRHTDRRTGRPAEEPLR